MPNPNDRWIDGAVRAVSHFVKILHGMRPISLPNVSVSAVAMHTRHLNEQMVRVLKTIGYDIGFCRGDCQGLPQERCQSVPALMEPCSSPMKFRLA